MIKTSLRRTGRMAGITTRTVVYVATHTIVIIIHFGFIAVLVAVDACKLCIICRIGMAIGTAIPLSLVLS